MSLLLKDPSASLDYAIDWGRQYLDGDTLSESNWVVTPLEEGGLTLEGSSFDERVSSVKLAGGRPGHVYRASNHVVTTSGREDSRSVVLRIEVR